MPDNNALFIDKKFEKEIYRKSVLRIKHLKHPANSNWVLYRRQRNKFVQTKFYHV